jgi:hypothetical protein
MQAPPPGTRAACPQCGQLFETPAALAPGPRARRDDRWDEPSRLPHSGLGVASFIISLIVIVLTVLVVLLSVVARANRAHHSTADAMLGITLLFGCTGLLACVVGLSLGVAGVFQEDRNRTFAVVGIILNGLVILGTVALILIGMASATWR